MLVDDDSKGECFRVYDSAEESFRDHSDFLRYRDRYKFLFDFKTTDYKSWAYGLKQAGYATDPSYASKLIKCVEDYNLSRYDRMTVFEALAEGGAAAEAPVAQDAVEAIPDSPLKIEAGEIFRGKAGEEYHFSLSRTLYSRNSSMTCRAARSCTRAMSYTWSPRRPRPSAAWTSTSSERKGSPSTPSASASPSRRRPSAN